MKYFDWNETKNEWLKTTRNVSFEEIVQAIKAGKLLNTEKHHDQKKYPGQQMFTININNYAYNVPFIEDDEKLFLKTIIPSRKNTKKYLSKK
jgi:hypothetical protein